MTDPGAQGFRLSPSQRRLRAVAGAAHGRLRSTCTVRVHGGPGHAELAAALEAIANRHESLRTRFTTGSGLEIAAQVVGSEPVLEWQVHQVAPGIQELSLDLPALCGDRVTLRNIVAELAGGGAEPVMQFADAAAWQNDLLESADAAAGRAIWTRHFDVDAQWPRVGRGAPTGDVRRIGAQLAMPLPHPGAALAAWQIVIHRICRQRRLVFGLVCDGRTFPELEQASGLYARVVPIWSRLRHEPFAACADRIELTRRDAMEWQDYFSADLIFGDPALRFPVQFECVASAPEYRSDAASFRITSERSVVEPFDLKLTVETAPGEMRLDLAFDTGRIEEHQAHGILEAVERVLRGGLDRDDQLVTDLALSGAEKRSSADDAGANGGRAVTVLDRIRAVAADAPDRVAVASGDEHVTYAALTSRAEHLAASIGPQDDGLAAVFLDRGVDAVVAIIGTWLAGRAYVPTEWGLPHAAATERLNASGADTAIATKAHADIVSSGGLRAICVDDLGNARRDVAPVDPAALAYVISTSGSTGRRKAVGVEHRQLAHYVEHIGDALDLSGCTAFACVTTLAADLAHTMVFSALALGRTLHLFPHDAVADPHRLLSGLRDAMVDCVKLVPSHLGALMPVIGSTYPLPALRRLVLGGESCPSAIVDEVADRLAPIRIFNHYGPTETTVGVLTGDRTRLNRPVGRSYLSIVDEFGFEVPDGSTGELCVGGPQVARGYVNDASATAQAFVPDARGTTPGARIYRTGDLARVDASGAIELVGRVDRQVKIGGYRVEPAEIEGHIVEHPSVIAAAVLPLDGALEPALTAYVARRPDAIVTASELRAHLAGVLPGRMIPSSFVVVDALPVTTNGKVDVAALRRVAPSARAVEPVAPRSETEERIAAAWRNVLGCDAVGVDDNFFELGGHSLLLLRLHQQLHASGLTGLSVVDLFAHPTVASLAAFVGGVPGPAASVEGAAARGDNLARVRESRQRPVDRSEGIA